MNDAVTHKKHLKNILVVEMSTLLEIKLNKKYRGDHVFER